MNPRAIRTAMGMTQSQLARALGVHRETVSRWEAGTEMSPMAERAMERLVVEHARVGAGSPV